MRTPEDRATLDRARQIKRNESRERKQHRPPRVIPTGEGQRRPRVKDAGFLMWIRGLPCVAGLVHGGCSGRVQAAHFRASVPGRPNPGMGRKPDDRWSTPLCAGHHLYDQHRGGELGFWRRLGIDPVILCGDLYAAYQAARPGVAVLKLHARDGFIK